ncbi:hypothetical protein [Brachyspira murdochii]|uniref:Lipoprotein n=1 Tax=Brachyspira murdochii (strain ATCC 51284 / DSM 12563 / 56-150) TaxID=526224 RepID=D5U813_BRAM5|nr:hypothetical protein [Brachyspira murdochii]ADG70836.1 conserved hypothetical protein [Brachyspira murdochii DSM 12563]
MFKKIILLLISLFILSCTSSLGSSGMKFKDRAGTYESKNKNIIVTVSKEDKQNLKIVVYAFNGITVNSETFDITSVVTTGNFTIKSKLNSSYTYILNFYGNTSLLFSVRDSVSYKISNVELNNSTK